MLRCLLSTQNVSFTFSLFKYLAECNPFYFENKFESCQRSIYLHPRIFLQVKMDGIVTSPVDILMVLVLSLTFSQKLVQNFFSL